MQSEREVERLKKVYADYQKDPGKQSQWSDSNPGNHAILMERQNLIRKLLEVQGYFPLHDKFILEIGCGTGNVLASFLNWNAKPQNLYGVDLLPERIESAKKSYSEFHFQCLNAEKLEFPSDTFDLVLFFTVFSSILNKTMRERVALEAGRVLKKSGAILWYDFRYNNPSNPHVRGISRNAIQLLFPGYACFLQTISLLPPLTRRFGNFTEFLYPLLSHLVLLRTHYAGLLIKP